MLTRDTIQRYSPKLRVEEQASLRAYTSFHIGGPADLLAQPDCTEQLVSLIRLAIQHEQPFVVLGRGSNVLVADEGIRGLVIVPFHPYAEEIVRDKNVLFLPGGVLLSRAAQTACAMGLGGLAFAAGIPGTVGGAVVMNAGAYGAEMAPLVEQTLALDDDGKPFTLDREEHLFGYRTSYFTRHPEAVVLQTKLILYEEDPETIRETMRTLAQKRRDKQPLENPSAGSVFKRPEGYFAGALIESCGLKGFQVGGAQVSEKHAGFIVNVGEATCDDVLRVMHHVQETVFARHGVRLEPEIRRVGPELPARAGTVCRPT